MTPHNHSIKTEIQISLPDWTDDYISSYRASTRLDDRVAFVLNAAKLHIEKKTGGPFAAAVFESTTGKLISLGVNLVPSEQLSCLHAEVVALSLAQKALGEYSLNAPNLPKLELITSTEPCAMCLGAIPWSGIPKIVCAARGEDACEIGFDEGDKPEQWVSKLQQRGIEVMTEHSRPEAREILQQYARQAGEIYNGKAD